MPQRRTADAVHRGRTDQGRRDATRAPSGASTSRALSAARALQAADRHGGAAADRAGDHGRRRRPGQRGAVQLLQLPVGRSGRSWRSASSTATTARRRTPAATSARPRTSPSTSSRDAILEAMNVCAVPFAPERRRTGRGRPDRDARRQRVACPWIGEAPAAFECRHYIDARIGNSREIILGEVRGTPTFAPTWSTERAARRPRPLDAIGRMGGHGYARSRDYFDLPTMSVDDWRSGRPAMRRPARHREDAAQ